MAPRRIGPAPRGPQQRVEHMLRDAPGSKAELLDLIKEEQAAGWEFAGQVNVGRDTQLVFKRPKGNPPVDRGPRGVPGFPPGVVPAPRDRDPFNPRAEDPRPSPRAPQPRDPRRDDTLPPRRGPVPPPAEPSLPPARRSAEDLPPPFAGPLPRPSDVPSETLPVAGLPVSEPVLLSQPMPTPILERAEIHVIELKHAAPMAMSQHVKQFFAEAEVGTDEDTGTLVIRCDKQTLENIEKLVEKLDKPSKTRVPSASIPPVSR